MEIPNPIFRIPDINNEKSKKPGRRGTPIMHVNPTKFSKYRDDRVKETDKILNQTDPSKKPILSSGDRLFYKIEFRKKALSKTAQPRALLEKSHIDVYAQISEKTFLASSTINNLISFRQSISNLTIENNKKDSAYLSAITKIGIIERNRKMTFKTEDKKSFRAYLFLADVLSENEGKNVLEEIDKNITTGAENTEYFISESGAKVIYGSFSRSFIDEISEEDPRNPVIRIEKSMDFLPSQDLPTEYDFKSVSVGKIPLDAQVAIVDSGIYPHQMFKDCILDVEDCIQNPQEDDYSHGTFVAGRIIFGNDIENQIDINHKLEPKTRVLDIRVMKKNGSSDKEIRDALLKVITNPKYNNIKVFNLSLNFPTDQSLLEGTKSFFTRELDSIAYKYKICFIVTAGNHPTFHSLDYPDCLNAPNSIITPPGDIINGLSVGSLADTDSSRALAHIGEPSPFTRTGLIGYRKPDVVHFGGNCDRRGNSSGIGVKSFSVNPQKISEDCGTSYAAPLVSSIAAQIYAYLKSMGVDSVDLAKALLLHSAIYNLPAKSKINQQDLHRIVGFGIPDFDRALNCAKSSATFFYTGNIQANTDKDKETREYKHKIKFVIPPELAAKGKETKIRGTLVYMPQISEGGHQDYSLADIEVNLHYKNSNGTNASAGLSSEINDYRIKWNTVKYFEKRFSNSSKGKYIGGDWEIWLTLTTRGRADIKGYAQEYALVITVEDVTPDATNRLNVSQIIKEQYKVYIPISQQIRERIKV